MARGKESEATRTRVRKLEINESTRHDRQHQRKQLLEVCHFLNDERGCHVGTWRVIYRDVVLGQADENELGDVVTGSSELRVYGTREEDERREDRGKGEEEDDLEAVRHKQTSSVTLLEIFMIMVYVVSDAVLAAGRQSSRCLVVCGLILVKLKQTRELYYRGFHCGVGWVGVFGRERSYVTVYMAQ